MDLVVCHELASEQVASRQKCIIDDLHRHLKQSFRPTASLTFLSRFASGLLACEHEMFYWQ